MILTLLDVVFIVLAAVVLTLRYRKTIRRWCCRIQARLRRKPGKPVRTSDRPQRDHGQIWRDTEALINFYREIDGRPTLPPLRNWSINPDNLPVLAERIRQKRPRLVLECGCGSSTVAMALLLRANKIEGRIQSFESHAESAERTRAHLSRLGLDAYSDIRLCDLVPRRYPGFEWDFKWYALGGFQPVGKADMLFVDAPPGYFGKLSRYPAGPELIPHLAPGASIFIDDALREDEIEMVRLWREAYPGLAEIGHDAEKGLIELQVSPG